MRIFSFICNIRGFILSMWYGIGTEGHFYKETNPEIYKCWLCGDTAFSLHMKKQFQKIARCMNRLN